MRSALIVGTGLIGTSVGLALSQQGMAVHLTDTDPAAAHAAAALGAGTVGEPAEQVDIAVLGVPPAEVAPVLADLQRRRTARFHTDVASVKAMPCREMTALGCDTSSVVGGHPLAGGEQSGPLAARGSLFRGRPWVLVPNEQTSAVALDCAMEVVTGCGATPVLMGAEEHDRAVALVSHAPHLVATLLAARMLHGDTDALRLAGQGVRDTTRIAAGRATLWTEILAANAGSVADVLEGVASDLLATIATLRELSTVPGTGAPGLPATDELANLTRMLQRGVDGRARIATARDAATEVSPAT